MTGVIEGGTGFVVAAYTVTALVLGGYLASVVARYRRAARQGGQASRPPR